MPREVAQERFDRLVETVQRSAFENNAPLVGTVQRVLVEGASKRDASVLSGPHPAAKVVHAALPTARAAEELAGTFVDVEIETAQTWFLGGRLVNQTAPAQRRATPTDRREQTPVEASGRAGAPRPRERSAVSSTFGVIAPHPPIMVDAVGGVSGRRGRVDPRRDAGRGDSLAVFDPDTVVIMSPHAPVAADAFLVDGSSELSGSLAQFGDHARTGTEATPSSPSEIVNLLDATQVPAALRLDVRGASRGRARPRGTRAA